MHPRVWRLGRPQEAFACMLSHSEHLRFHTLGRMSWPSTGCYWHMMMSSLHQ